jgi:cytosine/adenosine deaminase-related metal-dependent hydrolase
MPGLISIHAHCVHESLEKGVREEHFDTYVGNDLYERMASFWAEDEGFQAATKVACCELLTSGVTTVLDMSVPFDGWIDVLAQSGLRCYVAPDFTSATYQPVSNQELGFKWQEDEGKADFAKALKIVKEADMHPSGRLMGVISPAQIDNCTEQLLRESYEIAQETNRIFTIHAAQLPMEFKVIVERTGKTPIQWANEIGILGPSTIIAHAIYIDDHSTIDWDGSEDLQILALSGASIAHCPTGFARWGVTLESFTTYKNAGINIGVGTDNAPHNILEEMRSAIIAARYAGDLLPSTSSEDLLNAATISGAKALGREDLGKLAIDMKADFITVDLNEPSMRPVWDPLLSLIYHAADRAVKDVYVDGVRVVENGKPLTFDYPDALTRLENAQQEMLGKVKENDYLGRSIHEMIPPSLPFKKVD